MTSRVFTLDQLNDWDVSYVNELKEEIDSGRWTRSDRVIFQAEDDGKFYSVTVEEGLTEYQDLDLNDRYPDSRGGSVSCPEVEKRVEMKPVTLWVAA